jgi:photosystem II stability/assembly factor-like uncharacterized protein
MIGAAYGNGKFVVAGYAAPASGCKLAYSSDQGTTWTPVITTYSTMSSLTFDGEKFLLTGSAFCLYISYDGITWTASTLSQTLFGSTSEYGACAMSNYRSGGNTIVVGGNHMHVAYRVGISNWAVATVPSITLDSLAGLVWTGTKFVMVATQGYIFTSATGTSWAQAAYNGGYNFNAVAMTPDGQTLVTVGNYGRMYTSTTGGTTWTTNPSYGALISNTQHMTDICYTGNRFIAVGSGGKCVWSLDAVTWIEDTTLPTLIPTNSVLASDGTVLVCAGNDGTIVATSA